MNGISVCALGLLAFVQLAAQSARGWDYPYHRVVNQLALTCLPTNFPGFARTPEATERIGFLAGEPDRWRNVRKDLSFQHCSGPDHYMDLEALPIYGLKPEMLPVFRFDFAVELAQIRKAHPEKFPEIDAAKNEDHTRELIGFLPWAIVENYSKLKSGFAYLRTFRESG